MTKTLYLMCHGETLFNTLRKNEGWSDSPLTERGIACARAVARDFFAARHIEPEELVCSHAERACDTLELVSEELFGEVRGYRRLKGLKEQNYGSYEAKDEFLNAPLPYGSFFVRFGGESDEELAERMRTTLDGLMAETSAATILAVSHPRACAAFLGTCGATAGVETPGCGVYVLAFDEGTRTFTCVEQYPHEDAEAAR